ncbi:MAG: hypothetical protein WD042_17925 [Phycisphaeraceae bacterium]
MYVYAGIDEAGYGPLFGPLTIGRCVLGLADMPGLADAAAVAADTAPPPMWSKLRGAVCRTLTGRKGRLPVNDSKKLYSPATGLRNMELSVLAFAAAAGHRPATVDAWLDCLGETTHRDLAAMPWYQPCDLRPWATLPTASTIGELAVARNLLTTTTGRVGVSVLDMGAAVVFEDRFNRMVTATRSKAAASYTFVGRHLRHIWDRFGEHQPQVIVDRQSGRMRYRELLAIDFPDAHMTILGEDETRSVYRLAAGDDRRHTDDRPGHPARAMTVTFVVDADADHMPVALASMISKYTRELLMDRFNAYFTAHAPAIKPTAGYAQDATRFWREIEPMLTQLNIQPNQLRRLA